VVVIIIAAAVGGILLMGGDDEGTKDEPITQKGSDTMLELCQLWAQNFTANEDIEVSIAGGGSGTGITALVSGDVDVAQASRQIKQSEIDQAKGNGVDPVEWRVAVDGIAVIVNSANPVKNLTMKQLDGIYNGTITNWKDVGGNDLTIILYGRNAASGTYAYFQEVVLKNGNYSTNMQQFTGSQQLLGQVEDNAGGIGYVGIGYASDDNTKIEILKLQANSTSPAYSPLDETAVYNKSYPLARYLYLYTDGYPDGSIYKWLDFILTSTKGQTLAVDSGFYALPDDILAQERTRLTNHGV
jgi:phosphate transport system substrate-binding protein